MFQRKCFLAMMWEVPVHQQQRDHMVLGVPVNLVAPGKTADWRFLLQNVWMMSHKEQNGNGTRNSSIIKQLLHHTEVKHLALGDFAHIHSLSMSSEILFLLPEYGKTLDLNMYHLCTSYKGLARHLIALVLFLSNSTDIWQVLYFSWTDPVLG